MSPGPGNRSFTTTTRAVSKNTEAAPAASAIAMITQSLAAPVTQSRYRAAKAAVRAASMVTSTRQASSRSTRTPAGSPTARYPSVIDAADSPEISGLRVRSRTSSGMARTVRPSPSSDTACPDRNTRDGQLTPSWWRSRGRYLVAQGPP
jgi:hypothetical protein